MPPTDAPRGRLRTVIAMALLSQARLMVELVPFNRWKLSLGCDHGADRLGIGRHFAAQIERAARRLPFEAKCLPQAMALSWILRRRLIRHAVVFAVRPVADRSTSDALHVWVEVAGERVLGDLPGPWIETLRLPQGAVAGRQQP